MLLEEEDPTKISFLHQLRQHDPYIRYKNLKTNIFEVS